MNKQVQSIPRHIAIIPDGNRRWARERGLSTYEGHETGVEKFRQIVRHAADQGVQCISVWGLSVDNILKRSPREIFNLMKIFQEHFTSLVKDQDIHDRQIRIKVFGRWQEKFPSKVRRAIEAAQDATKHYQKYACNFLLAYNGTDEMIEAVKKIAENVKDPKKVKVTAAMIKQNLFTKDLPPVDLVIRTGGEPHLSAGFMMWDIADAQLHFTNKYWPAFSNQDFDKALAEYSSRQRRLGG